MTRRLLIVTHIDFWTSGSGHRSRLFSLVKHLQNRFSVTVVYAGRMSANDWESLSLRFPAIDIYPLAEEQPLTFGQYAKYFSQFIKGRIFDRVLVEYIEMSFILPFLHGNPVTFLDTHDIVHERIRSFKDANVRYDGIVLSREEEFNIFNCYDYVIAIQQSDHKKLAEVVGEDRAILVPHPAVVSPVTGIRRVVQRIGFIASAYESNVEGLSWFIKEVWNNAFQSNKIILSVYGTVCEAINRDKEFLPNIEFEGFVPDLQEVYRNCDIVINPVRCGAGLKIKNVEAISAGLPLLTTSHSAIGLPDSDKVYYLSADGSAEFQQKLMALCDDYNIRMRLSQNALEISQTYFSPEACFGKLVEKLAVSTFEPH